MSNTVENSTTPQALPESRRKLTLASLVEFIVQGGPRRWTIAILLLVLAALALMSVVRGLAFQMLVVPILYFLWVLRLLLDGIPQPFFWAVAVFLFIRIVYPSLFSARRPIHASQIPEGGLPEGRVTFWLRRLTLARTGRYSKWGMARNMAKLATDVLSYQGKLTPGEVRERLQRGEYELSPEAAIYLQSGMSAQPPATQTWWARFWRRLGLRREPDVKPTLSVDLEQLLRFLENEMEVVHDIEDH